MNMLYLLLCKGLGSRTCTIYDRQPPKACFQSHHKPTKTYLQRLLVSRQCRYPWPHSQPQIRQLVDCEDFRVCSPHPEWHRNSFPATNADLDPCEKPPHPRFRKVNLGSCSTPHQIKMRHSECGPFDLHPWRHRPPTAFEPTPNRCPIARSTPRRSNLACLSELPTSLPNC